MKSRNSLNNNAKHFHYRIYLYFTLRSRRVIMYSHALERNFDLQIDLFIEIITRRIAYKSTKSLSRMKQHMTKASNIMKTLRLFSCSVICCCKRLNAINENCSFSSWRQWFASFRVVRQFLSQRCFFSSHRSHFKFFRSFTSQYLCCLKTCFASEFFIH